MKRFANLLAAVVLAAGASDLWGASVVFRTEQYEVTPEMVARGVPEGALIHDHFVTTDADILSVGQVIVERAELYRAPNPWGTEADPPPACFLIFDCNPEWFADAFITTPGDTSRLGPPLPGDGTSAYGDLSNDGAQNNFLFARLTTLPGKKGDFSGRVTLAGSAGPESFPFSFPIGVPEPSGLALMGFGLVGVLGQRGFKTPRTQV